MMPPRDFSGWHADHIPTAVVWAVCSHHNGPGEKRLPLAAWAAYRDGRVAGFYAGGLRQEAIDQWVPTAAQVADIRLQPGLAETLGGFAVAKVPEGDEPYWRQILECPRETCSYRYELTPPTLELVRELVRTVATAGGQRLETHLSRTPQTVIELNAYVKDPTRAQRRVLARGGPA